MFPLLLWPLSWTVLLNAPRGLAWTPCILNGVESEDATEGIYHGDRRGEFNWIHATESKTPLGITPEGLNVIFQAINWPSSRRVPLASEPKRVPETSRTADSWHVGLKSNERDRNPWETRHLGGLNRVADSHIFILLICHVQKIDIPICQQNPRLDSCPYLGQLPRRSQARFPWQLTFRKRLELIPSSSTVGESFRLTGRPALGLWLDGRATLCWGECLYLDPLVKKTSWLWNSTRKRPRDEPRLSGPQSTSGAPREFSMFHRLIGV